MRIRLDRWLTALALASRSEGKVLIRRGAVTVNGRTVLDPGAVFEKDEQAGGGVSAAENACCPDKNGAAHYGRTVSVWAGFTWRNRRSADPPWPP